ncbi:MAG: aldehyde ferredoxin oxidoreductase C-terminal domain-containing protein, partial [Candidatus Hermodarchaeota archaeon]
DKVEIRKADHLWGKDTYETVELIRKMSGNRTEVACIGQAGEKMVSISSIMIGGKESRAAGRCGLGAVMGSKNLKAISVSGSKTPKVADRTSLIKSIKECISEMKDLLPIAKRYGTPMVLIPGALKADLPVKNWQLASWEDKAKNISGEVMADTILTGSSHCSNCVISCGRMVRLQEGPFAPVDGAGPEYQTLAMFGSNCLIDNLEAIAKANELCNRYGLDTISTGAIVAFTIECFENIL